jgi:hypothetical protein
MEEAMAQLRKERKLLSAHFAGPFDDFGDVRPVSSQIPLFSEVDAKLEKASALTEVPELVALAYTAKPSERIVADVVRLLAGPVDMPISNKETEAQMLGVCAHIAAVARSAAIANAVINRCLFLLDQRERVTTASDLMMVAINACAAHSSPYEHRKMLERTLVRCAFILKEIDDLSSLNLILDVLCIRDERLTPAVGRARAVAVTKMGRN